MAHLTDMEELISSIISKEEADYMREAMGCYMAGAYRGCIVLSYIALFDDLLAKLAELGKVNKKAKGIYQNAEKKKTDQQVFESYLIDQLRSNNLLSGLDAIFLDTLRNLRNKSAHPSGHKPSPEEARFIFYEVVNRFLSKPILSTMQLIDDLIERMKNTNFFPTSSIKDIKDIVEEEISSLHEEAMPQLVIKLTEQVLSSETDLRGNAGFFLSGLAALNDEKINDYIRQKLIAKKSDDEKFSLIIIRVITANGELYKGCSATVLKRLKNIIARRIGKVTASTAHSRLSHPIAFFGSLLENIEEDEIIEKFESQLENLFEKFAYSNNLINSLRGKTKTKMLYFNVLKEKAGSSSYDIANEFARSMSDIDDELSEIISNKQAFELILEVIRAADGGAFGAKDMKNTKFSPSPKIKEKALSYCTSNATNAESKIDEILGEEVDIEEFIAKYLS